MTNFQVYRKTISFSLVQFLVDLATIAVFVGLCVAGFAIGAASGSGLIGLGVGLILGIIVSVLVSYLISNRIKAAQIAMITKGVTEGNLPDHTFSAGLQEVKTRFATFTMFFFVTNAIKSVFRQIGRGINRIGTAIGGDVGNSVTSIIDSIIQTLIAYLCDCCLGWVCYRKDQNAAKSAIEGAAIFFKHGKTLIRNFGRIFGMGFLSFLLIGGAFAGLSYLIYINLPGVFGPLATELIHVFESGEGEVPGFLYEANVFVLVAAAFTGIVLWSVLHSVLVRPFILTGVLRNFMNAGIADMPTEADLRELDGRFPKIAKLRNAAE